MGGLAEILNKRDLKDMKLKNGLLDFVTEWKYKVQNYKRIYQNEYKVSLYVLAQVISFSLNFVFY